MVGDELRLVSLETLHIAEQDPAQRPGDIPRSYNHAVAFAPLLARLIREAVAGEREACAQIAEHEYSDTYWPDAHRAGEGIAAAIRARGG